MEWHSDGLEEAKVADHAQSTVKIAGACRDNTKDKTEIVRVILSDHRPPILLPSYRLPPSSPPFSYFYTYTPTLCARYFQHLFVHNEHDDSEPPLYPLGYR